MNYFRRGIIIAFLFPYTSVLHAYLFISALRVNTRKINEVRG